MANPAITTKGITRLAAVVAASSALAAGCLAIADIGDLQFIDPPGPSGGGSGGAEGGQGGSTGGAAGAGGSTVGGGGSAGATTTTSGGGQGGQGGGGQGGAEPTCDDHVQNGQETGVDCGGPDCIECYEDCTNGLDDDENELADCEDPTCSDYHCVPVVPQDWIGPVILFLEASPQVVPICDSPWPTQLDVGAGSLTVPDAECAGCTCAAPDGATCVAPTIEGFAANDCTGSPLATATPDANDCIVFGGPTYQSARRVGSTSVTGGQCTPGGGEATLPAVSWAERGVLCAEAPVGGGCALDRVCAPRPTATFGQSGCIYRAGDESCPTQGYTVKHLVYADVADTRDCVDCTCSTPSGMSCSAVGWLFTTQQCAQTPTELPSDGTCLELHGFRSAEFTAQPPTGGSCDPSTTAPTGTAVPDQPMTVCCAP